MNPFPASWCAIGAGLALVAGAWGGWTARDWKRDSEVLGAMKAATKTAEESAKWMRDQGDLYEKDRQNDASRSTVRESTINTIYRDRAVPADCAVPDAAGRVLDDAIDAANARRSGQSGSGLPAGGTAPDPLR